MRIAAAAIAAVVVAGLAGGAAAGASEGETGPLITQLEWSPDGKWLAFTLLDYSSSERSGVFVVRSDRSVQRRALSVDPDSPADFHWSPDSRRLAISDYLSTWVAQANGRNAVRFDGGFGDWSPDGQRLLLSRTGIYVLDLASGESRFLANGFRPDWSPDGRRIAFMRIVGSVPTACFYPVYTRIFSVDTNGGDLRQLSADEPEYGYQALAGYGPDSRRIAYLENLCTGLNAVLAPADGSRTLTTLGEGWPIWSPGGRRIALGTGPELRIVTDAGRALAEFDNVHSFAWGPGGGSVAYVGESLSGGLRLFVARARGHAPPREVAHVFDLTPLSWSRTGWIAFAATGSCSGGGERVVVIRPNGKRRHALSRCRTS